MFKKQQGATLIVVLLILIAITTIGALAIRSSTTQLQLITSAQAQQLMIQNSDAALFQFETPSDLERNMALNGMFGFLKAEEDSGKELVFCYKAGDTQFFDLTKASLIHWDGNKVTNNGLSELGFCKIDGGYFSTHRKTVMTQVAIKAADMSEAAAFQHMQIGTDAETAKIDPAQLFTVVATTIFPDVGKSVSDSSIADCFKNHFNAIPDAKAASLQSEITDESSEDKKNEIRLAKLTVSQCLIDLGVPTHTQVATYSLMQNIGK
ncbi:pilus assembly protein PilX [Acinetobacter sp. 187]|uniref:pilus assembly PilX family protein n=1 Tax=Acinetobacter lanii TaxID=2715163 RepID=UPI00140C0830|nr:pilus assembly protein PilX [Acinetobacter lanii]NHC02910.1 pilus assembly protein PilX [Acinetobacter lanii]